MTRQKSFSGGSWSPSASPTEGVNLLHFGTSPHDVQYAERRTVTATALLFLVFTALTCASFFISGCRSSSCPVWARQSFDQQSLSGTPAPTSNPVSVLMQPQVNTPSKPYLKPPSTEPPAQVGTQSHTLRQANSHHPPPQTKSHPHISMGGDGEVESKLYRNPSCVKEGRAKTFIMVFMGHSGSTALCSELKEHPEVHMELMEMLERPSLFSNKKAALQATREFFDRGIRQGKTPGFKIRPHHIFSDPAAWHKLAVEYNTRIIWQHRGNTLKKAVGEYTVRRYKDRSAIMGLRKEDVAKRCDVGAGCAFEVDDMKQFNNLMRIIETNDRSILGATKALDGKRGCVQEVLYEDYLYERERTVRKLQDFLGLTNLATEPQFAKATNDNLCKVITNWQEVCDNFYQCKQIRPFLNDFRNNCTCTPASFPSTFCS